MQWNDIWFTFGAMETKCDYCGAHEQVEIEAWNAAGRAAWLPELASTLSYEGDDKSNEPMDEDSTCPGEKQVEVRWIRRASAEKVEARVKSALARRQPGGAGRKARLWPRQGLLNGAIAIDNSSLYRIPCCFPDEAKGAGHDALGIRTF